MKMYNIKNNTIRDVKDVQSYLDSRGWKVSLNTVYRHVSEGILRRNKENVFDIAFIDRYAKRNLKRGHNIDVNTRKAERNEGVDVITAETDTICDIKGVSSYLICRGWNSPKTTLHRHIAEGKLKRNRTGSFEILDVEKYARKYLKCLNVTNASSEKAGLFFRKALLNFYSRNNVEEIINFVSGDVSKVEELKTYLINEAGKFFKLENIKTGDGDE